MGLLRPAAVAIGFAIGCAPKLPPVDFGANPGPVWPAPPDRPMVAYVGEIGGPGAGFSRPLDVACRGEHELAVADPDAGAVWLLDLRNGRWHRQVMGGGKRLQAPVGVAWLPDGRYAVVDSARRAVLAGEWPGGGALRPWYSGDPLVRPVALVPYSDHQALVVDSAGHGLYRIGEGEAQVAAFEVGRGEAGQGFNFPVDAAFDGADGVFVADALNAVVELLRDGELSAFAGGAGYGGARMVRPKGVAVDGAGRVHVVDAGMQHVLVFDRDGRWLGRYGQPGAGAGELGLPAGICIDEHRHVFVADSLNRRVQIFRLLE